MRTPPALALLLVLAGSLLLPSCHGLDPIQELQQPLLPRMDSDSVVVNRLYRYQRRQLQDAPPPVGGSQELLLVHHLGPQKIAYEIGSTRMVHFMTDELDTILRVYQQKLEGRLHLLLSLG
ncbi:hypothetical protein B0O80DRAFT_429444 [Mortierella sp. GBAus27b]|nr:hypothetical protein B0O80DRAFT_429444 [Mortierella sp. GBAus27b]